MTGRRGLVVALLITPACGGNVSEGSSAVTAEEFPERYAAAFCELTSRCCAMSGGEPHRDDCGADTAAVQGAEANAAIRVGASFDTRAAEYCLTELEQRSCEPDPLNVLAAFLPACQVWRGATTAGGACRLNLECARESDAPLSCVEDRCQVVEQLLPSSECDPHETTAACSGFSRCDAETMRCEPLPRAGDSCTDACRGDVCLDGRCASLLVGHHCTAPE